MWTQARELLEAGIPDMAQDSGGNIWLQKGLDRWIHVAVR